MKIFGIGLSRTGTSSLATALDVLGYSCTHYPHDQATLDELSGGNYALSVMQHFDAATDISVAPYYVQLDAAFPGSKFILTTRDETSWLHSLQQHFTNLGQTHRFSDDFLKFTNFIHMAVYGTTEFNANKMRTARREHEASVREYFTSRPGDLLVLDICENGDWEPLTTFLNEDIPAQAFPYKNPGRNVSQWDRRVEEILENLREELANDSSIILIDNGKLSGAYNSYFDILPFPQKNGSYSGNPETSDIAIDELQQLIHKGAGHVLLTWPAFWWREKHAAFLKHLDDNFKVVIENECMVLYKHANNSPG